ncbi:unnamed protein product [Nezara viridula]|uniref:Mitochondrial fission regulator 2 n=2 Tax=Nezara viridula TaxID=85310 RepID=A0A9P0H6Y0_NEZVI|nr:unnamed protein product [Nezara viridula]
MSTILNFLRSLCDFLQKVKDVTFPLIVNGKRPRRSIVRFIGTNLPIPSPPRVYIYVPPWRTLDKKLSQTTIQSDISSLSIDDNSSREENEIPCDCSDISCMHETKLTQLQNELKELREQVASILLKQNSSTSSQADEKPAPALPPPPPPPLPPPFDISSPFVTPKRKPLTTRNDNVSNNNPLGDVLKEIKNGPPKLKPIERSPGGRPIKRPKILSDPSDILTEVLKKRFIAVHFSSDTNDSDTSSLPDGFSQSDWNS